MRCCCPTDEVVKRALKSGLQSSQIKVYGLPVRPSFVMAVCPKVLVIALLLKIIMKRRFSVIQWEALALLLIGISINQMRSLPQGGSALGVPIELGAYIYTCIFEFNVQVTVPSLASVYNEYALKSQYDTSIYLQNLFLYGYGAIFNFLGILGTFLYKVLNKLRSIELKIGWGKSVSLPSQAVPAPPPGHMAIRSKEGATVFLSGPSGATMSSVPSQKSQLVLTPCVLDIIVAPPKDDHVVDTMAPSWRVVLLRKLSWKEAAEILFSLSCLTLDQRSMHTMSGGCIPLHSLYDSLGRAKRAYIDLMPSDNAD
ncbi:hypothetical protein POM88_000138 [Heracleum sosnowskyi]|uniref:Uncharacterized protein n=1 Tax=Heracleum sosnowskyi TaxID=360622 RepID=A0AAD8NAL2_9APIA|nr:hypothetical protein POM88_000138 [Heracleum sosnowskyi]